VDERRSRIHEDLRGIIEGELLFEPLERAPYARDASLYEIDPLGVIAPRTESDVVNLVRYASEMGLAIHARGAGTGVAGESLGAGLVVDFSRHLRRIVAITHDAVIVQPGVVLDVLNEQLAPLGRRIGPDPVGSEAATIGGMIGVNAAGPRALRYGAIRDHVERLRVVFADGEVAELGREPIPAFEDEPPAGLKGMVLRKLGALVRRNVDLLTRKTLRGPGGHAGYAIDVAAMHGGIDLARVVAGSEGTLALITEATLRTVPIPSAQAVVILPFARLVDAASAVASCLTSGPAACELYDWRTIRLVRDASAIYRDWISEAAEAVLVVDFEGDEQDKVAGQVRELSSRMERNRALVANPVELTRRADIERLLGLRRVVEPLLMRMRARSRPVPFIEDVTVPAEVLPEYLQRLQNILKQHDVSWTLDAHAGWGRVHLRPFIDMANPCDVAKLEPLATQLYETAVELGGTISGGSGCGLSRTQFLRKHHADLFPIFREVKDAFDPHSLLNPGKVIGDDPHLMTRDLCRLATGPEPTTGSAEAGPIFLPVLRWPDQSPVDVASACNGCGVCRTEQPTSRMCPMFRALHAEPASPRSKANLIRQLAAGSIDPKLWGAEEFKQNADLCIHCNLCPKECPSGVDVSSLMLEAKAAYVENHGVPPGDWWLSRIELWSRLASRLPILTNALLGSRPARWVFERLFGLSRLRRLPKAHRTPFVRRAARLGLTRPRPQASGPRVVYFVDTFANYFDQELAEAVVSVLHQAGVNVYVPARQWGSGMPALVAGDVDYARELALANLKVLGNAVRDGYSVVCSEPTAALALRQEYLKLTDDLDAGLVAENTRDLGQYLAGLHERGQLPRPLHPLRARVGYHQPCHLRALDVGTPGLDLIRTIPELDVEFIDRGCSGMAGTFGLSRDHFRTSLRAGRGLLSRLRAGDLELGATECGACRMQMEQGATFRTLHPIKLLSLSYGLNPSLLRQLKDPKPRHEIS
jgi:FAD/FMN-containing dehydrogenase/Fe-S oxidoreductase